MDVALEVNVTTTNTTIVRELKTPLRPQRSFHSFIDPISASGSALFYVLFWAGVIDEYW